MEYISKDDTQKFNNGAVTSWEYDMPSASLNVAHIKIEGRYPDEGFTSNRESDSIVYILGGQGILGMMNGESVQLSTDDQVHLAVNDRYYFEGSLDMLYAATPKWTPEQTEHHKPLQ